MTSTRLELIASKVVLGLIGPRAIIRAAVAALQEGSDSPSLRQLAGLSDSELNDALPLLARSLVELGSSMPAEGAAVRRVAREIAADISDGTTAPYDGANEISELTLRASGERFPELDPFVYAASEWEDRPEDRHAFSEAIVGLAERLSTPPAT